MTFNIDDIINDLEKILEKLKGFKKEEPVTKLEDGTYVLKGSDL